MVDESNKSIDYDILGYFDSFEESIGVLKGYQHKTLFFKQNCLPRAKNDQIILNPLKVMYTELNQYPFKRHTGGCWSLV